MTINWHIVRASGPLALVLLASACAQTSGSASDLNMPGATGRTIVPGSTSTVAGDAEATSQQQKWPLERGR